MTTPYLAGASSRPDIRQYFRNYLAYVGELETRLHVIADSVIDAHFARAGFDAATEGKLKGAFKRGFARTRENQTQMNAAMRKYAEDALRVHEFLASVDARVWPGVGNDLDFEDLKEQMQFATLIRTLERSETFLARAQDQAQVSTREAMRQAGVRP